MTGSLYLMRQIAKVVKRLVVKGADTSSEVCPQTLRPTDEFKYEAVEVEIKATLEF